MVCQLVECLVCSVGMLNNGLIGLSVGRLVGRLTNRLVSRLDGCQWVGRSVGWMVS